jgi:DNA-binding phage protein
MALTREFKRTVEARARRDPRFREGLFTEAISAYLQGDTATGRAILRDLVNATLGFERLAAEIQKPSKSVHRMLSPRGNPSSDSFFRIVDALQKRTRIRLRVTAVGAS